MDDRRVILGVMSAVIGLAEGIHTLAEAMRTRIHQYRTLQRRVRDWRVQDGPDHEVYFEQVAVPGREAAFDFTDASDLGVTLRGVGFPHLLFEWVLSYSRWTYVRLALSETFEALVAGVQGALWTLGAVPGVLRHDNLSAATHELRRSGGRQLTVRFRQVLDHYGLRSSRIQPGKPHENGRVRRRPAVLSLHEVPCLLEPHTGTTWSAAATRLCFAG